MNKETIGVFIAALVIFAAGWGAQGWRKDAEIARINTDAATAKSKAAGEALDRLIAANQRGDALALQLNGWQATLTQFALEKNHELARLTTGRRCLDSAAVRVLNRPEPQLGRSVPQAAGLALRADGGSSSRADDGSFSTDADIAGWIGLCQRSYSTCRARLQLIADFYDGERSPTAQAEAGDSARCADCGNQGNE